MDSFNLDPPPGFRGLDPELPIRRYFRHLPHYRQVGATYFVTFRLADSIPAQHRRTLVSMKRQFESNRLQFHSEQAQEAYAKKVFTLMERWLDQGHGHCWLAKNAIASEMQRSILHLQGERYLVSSFVIMPNHCHLAIKPFPDHELENVVGAMKSVVGKFINRNTGSVGRVWQQESFDRIIRDETHLFRVIQYIGNNPRKAGLAREHWRRWVYPHWEELGWGFRDP